MIRYLRLVGGGAALAAMLIVMVGCGGGGIKKASVVGTVTYEGKPLESGVISFTPAADIKGGGTAGGEIVGGKFSVPDVTPGKNTVTIRNAPARNKSGPMKYQDVKGKYDPVAIEKMRQSGNLSAEEAEKQMRGKMGLAPMEFNENAVGNNQVIDIKLNQDPLDIKLLKPTTLPKK